MKIFKKIKKTGSFVFIGLLLFTFPLSGQEVEDETDEAPPFVRELAMQLSSRGWSEEKLQALVNAARLLDWEGVSADTAEIAAFALHMGGSENEAETEDNDKEVNSLIQAQTALELALASMEMEELGYDEHIVARAALTGVRNMLSVIDEWKNSGQQENLGLLIREQVKTHVITAVRQRESAVENRGNADGKGIPKGMPAAGAPSLRDTRGRP